MRIKKLEIAGFKSFKDRTVIQFDAGITGIVGPNGCGKSNIVDALMWAMGEMSAKHLRGSSMEDVIFAGAEGYAPLGMCEVSLTLENDGGPFPVQYLKHSEIMVTRRLHRGGESEYFINKEPARLRDIQEIFMDTGAGAKGFSIIQQNAIGQLVTSKPEDRRHLIEEAAGITKFKARKRESQRKLVATDQNLVRLHDIVGELKRQIDSLERQAQRAERYRNLKKEADDLDLWLSSVGYIEANSALQSAAEELRLVEQEQAASAAQMDTGEAEVEQLKLRVLEKAEHVEAARANLKSLSLQVSSCESQIQELKFEIESARRNKEMTGGLVEDHRARAEALSQEVERLSGLFAEAASEADRTARSYEEKKVLWESMSGRIQNADRDLTSTRREYLTVSQGEAQVQAKMAGLEDAIQGLGERETEAKLVLEELLQKRVDFEARKKKAWNELEKNRQDHLGLARDVESFQTNRQSLDSQIGEKRAEVDRFQTELAEVSGKLYGLENLAANFEGFEAGVKSVMQWQKVKLDQLSESARAEHPLFQPLAEVVEVPEQFELAMEAALGPRLKTLLSADRSSVLGAVDHLKATKSGRSSFLSADGTVVDAAEFVEAEVQESVELGADQGRVLAVLSEAVRIPAQYKNTVRRLLARVAVVDSLATALELRPEHPTWTFVTRDGDTVSREGVISGGTAESADSGLLQRRREIKELSLKREEWSGKLALAQTALKKLEANLKKMDEDIEAAARAATEKEIQIAGLKKDLERAEQELSNCDQAIQRQERDVYSVSSQIDTRQNELDELKQRLENLIERKLELDAKAEELSRDLEEARSGVGSLQEEVARLGAETAKRSSDKEGLGRQLEMVEKQLADTRAQLSKMSTESEKSSESISSHSLLLEETKIRLDELIHQTQDAEAEVSRLRNDHEQMTQTLLTTEKAVAHRVANRNALTARVNEARSRREQAQMKCDYLSGQVRDRHMLELSEIAERYRERTGDLVEAELQLKQIREKLSKIGDVNLSAIEEYDQVKTRYEFLSKQQSDLLQAKEQLRKVIDRINRVCSKRFKETFDLVNERFTKVFPVLFGGGEAQLILVEDPEKGEMGIDIVAKPPGKKLQNMTLLSGGEKALTAVSLIFSIFLVRPSPYCLLDEVDAPLDDANVYRFNDLVKEMAKRSQIIVVTHNKFTMEVASRLYGVTMEERGVSKMVSVNLNV